MTEFIYFKDSYQKECMAIVTNVLDIGVVLDKTIFYPNSGGQPSDVGVIERNGVVFPVAMVTKKDGLIIHLISKAGLAVGDNVLERIDWVRRYYLMRMHTAAHLLSALFYKRAGALITGNQLDIAKSRIDFSLDSMDKELISKFIDEANDLIKKNLPVKIYNLPREEALKIPEIIKLAGALPPVIDTLRIVEIEGVDIQADGGTHVNSLKEIGKIELVSIENKGKNNRRIYFTLSP